MNTEFIKRLKRLIEEEERKEQEIKPCPFCGSEGRIKEYYAYKVRLYDRCRYKVLCVKDCCCLMVEDNTRQEAIDRWNKRS